MAKGYTFLDYSQPTSCSASAVAGGSLTASTTYYYRVMKVSPNASANYWYGRSKISDQFSVTTDSTNKTARITFSSTLESGTSYRIWRSTSSTAIGTTYLEHLAWYPADNTYNSGGTVTFDDDGSITTTNGNNFAEVNDNAHGKLTLSGSTSSDMFSIVDLYNADVAAGWGVIQRLDVNTYKVNCYLIGHTGLYWSDKEKTIIFTDGFSSNYSNSYFYFGDSTYSFGYKNGCNIIVTSPWLTGIVFPCLYAYRSTFTYVYPFSTPSLGLTSGGFSDGILQDCQIDRWRNFAPYSSSCTLRNVQAVRFDNLFDNSSATFNTVQCYGGSRVWQISGGATNLTVRNVTVSGAAIVLLIGAGGSTLTVVNTPVTTPFIINSSSTGFLMYDKFSFDLNVVDSDGVVVSGATVKIYDKDNNLVVDTTTDASGNIAQQEITRRLFTCTGLSYTTTLKYPFTIEISKSGYETYSEVVSYTSSTAIVKSVCLKTAKRFRYTDSGDTYFNLDQANSGKLIQLTKA